MSEIKRKSLPPRSSSGKDKNGSLEGLSKVTGFSSTVKHETEVKRECEDGWNQCALDEIVKKERIEDYKSESCLDPPKIQSGSTRGARTKPMSNQTNQNELTEGNIPKNKKRRKPQRRILERAAELGLDLPESAYERGKLLSKLRKRKQMANETPEKKAERLRRDAERQRILRANEDPEKQKERLKAQNEYTKKRAMETLEQAEARRRRHCEIQRESYKRRKSSEQMALKIARETPEEREERLRKVKEQRLERNERERFKRLERKLGMTEEEKAEERARNFFKKQALEAKMTQEELEAYKERRKELSKEYFKNLSGEKLERHKANMYKAAKKFQERNKERRRRKLEEDPVYRAKVRLNYRIIQAKQKLKRDLLRDGVSEEVIKEELTKLAERMRAQPLPPPETVSEYKPRPKRRRPVEKPEPVINPLRENPVHEQNLDVGEHLQEEDFAPPSPEADSPAPLHSPNSTDEAEEDRSEVPITSSKPAVQSPILPPVSHTVLVPAPPPSPSNEIDKTTSSENSSTKTQSEPTSSVHVNKATPLNLNWKCPICRTVLHSKENFSEHYNDMHKTVQKQQVEPQQAPSEDVRKLDKRNDKPKPSTPSLPTFICMKCHIPKQLTSGNTSFKGKGNLLAHVRQKHRKFYFPCPNCNILKYRKSALKDHLRVCES